MKHEPRPRRAISTTAGAAIIIVVIILAGIGIYLSSPSAQTSPTSNTSTISTQSPPSSSSPSSGGSTTVDIPQGASAGSNFSPWTLSVASGTTVLFVDQDSGASHDVYFTSTPSGASIATNPSPALQKGDTYQVTLTVPGTYTFECQFHSGWMQGTITVT